MQHTHKIYREKAVREQNFPRIKDMVKRARKLRSHCRLISVFPLSLFWLILDYSTVDQIYAQSDSGKKAFSIRSALQTCLWLANGLREVIFREYNLADLENSSKICDW